MPKNLFASLLGLLLGCSLFSQTPEQVLRGRIIDKDTRIPLIGVTISILETDPLLGTSTDVDGEFRMDRVPVGRYDLKVSYIGYEDMYIRQLLIGSGKEVILNLEMQEAVEQLETVEVVASRQDKGTTINDMATVSARSFTVEETGRYAGSLNDPARMAQSFAGVASANGLGNEIVIRGNSARGLQWRLEGIEIPNPNNFSGGDGSTGGGISILSNTIMANSDFFTGAFPAEYGNALSGVFDIRLRRGNNEKKEYAFQVGFLGLQAGLEGPFTKRSKASYLVNYRYSTLSLLTKMGFNLAEASIVPQYQDIGFHIVIPSKKAGQFTLFGLGGLSSGGRSADRDSSNWEKKQDLIDDLNDHKMGVIGMTYTYLLDNNKTYFKFIASLSGDESISRQDSLDQYLELRPIFKEQFSNRQVRTGLLANHKFSAHHLLRAGINYDWLQFRSALAKPDPSTGEITTGFNYAESDLIRSYFQWQWRPSRKVKMVSGIHHTTFLLNDNHVLDPRIGLQWQFRPRMSLSYGLGLHNQLEPLSLYSSNLAQPLGNPVFVFENGNSFLFSPRSTLRLTQSFHNVLGFDWAPAPDYRLKVEIYYQKVFNVPVKNDSTSMVSTLNYNSFSHEFNRSELVNKGFGRNYGLELTLEKFFSKNYYFLFTTSLFRSRYTPLDGEWRPGRFDRGYILNALGGKEFKLGKYKAHILGVNARIIWSGGNRYTPVDLEQSQELGYEVRLDELAFQEQYPDFFRLDMSLSYRWNKPKYALILTLEIQNLTNHHNIEAIYYDPYSNGLRTIAHLGWIPVFNTRMEF